MRREHLFMDRVWNPSQWSLRCVCSLRSQKTHSSWGSALAQGWEFCFQKSQVRGIFYFLCLPWCISTGCSLTLCLCLLLWKVSLKQHDWPSPFNPSYLLCVSHEEFLFPSIMLLFISLMLLLVTFLITLTKYVWVFLLRYSRRNTVHHRGSKMMARV